MESEKAVEMYLRDRVKSLNGKAYKFVSPGNIGVPDRLVVLPGGKVFFVEVKGSNGRLTANQKYQIKRLSGFGCKAYVIKSKTEVDEILKEWTS